MEDEELLWPSAVPGQVRQLVGDHLEVRQAEAWEPAREGRHVGTVAVEIAGAPVRMTGSLRLEPTADGGTILKILNPVNIAKAIAAVSIIGGIPAGVAAHAFDKRMSKVKNDEKKLELEADYYRDASSQLEDGMRASGMRV